MYFIMLLIMIVSVLFLQSFVWFALGRKPIKFFPVLVYSRSGLNVIQSSKRFGGNYELPPF